jgi:hypothetical protein
VWFWGDLVSFKAAGAPGIVMRGETDPKNLWAKITRKVGSFSLLLLAKAQKALKGERSQAVAMIHYRFVNPRHERLMVNLDCQRI